MSLLRFDPNAQWIWSSKSLKPCNNYVCFRRVINVSGKASKALLKITADSRYEVFVNGEWIGHGPPRSFLSPWPVDEYDVSANLKSGQNIIAVLVHHFGIGTFQYIHSSPGLLAQIDWIDKRGARRIVTGKSWRAKPNAGYAYPVPRTSIQRAWEEQFDARKAPDGWLERDFNDKAWPKADEVRAAGAPPHEKFERRDIPFLTREIVEPESVLAMETVRPAPYTWSINVHDFITEKDKTANSLNSRMLLATHIYSPKAQTIELHTPHGTYLAWKLNAKPLQFDQQGKQLTDFGVAKARLAKGWNTLIGRLPYGNTRIMAVMNIWTAQKIRFGAKPAAAKKNEIPWLALGPFDGPALDPGPQQVNVEPDRIPPKATNERFEAIWNAGVLSKDDLAAPFTRIVRKDMSSDDVFAISSSERIDKNAGPRIDDPSALQRDNADWTVIHPAKDGANVRLLLDFGKELVAYHEFEIDAPEGTIVDNHNFEFIQPDGRKNLAEGMNNSFRYTCREGAQTFRTFERMGFRYSWFTLRNFKRPIRVRFVRAIMSTYPSARRGSFACSDLMLERIWQVGAHSVRCCSEDTYTDCPTYEQVHWVGDSRNEALVDLVANGDPRLSAHCWIQAGRSLQRSPIVESHVPSDWLNLLPAWSFLWMRWGQEHFMLTGDKKLGKKMLPMIDRCAR